MSKTVDERVVSMQFDNKHFQANVSNTMSAIDKLKQKLNFSGASKGFESIDAASKRVDMNGLGSAVESVRSRFSALEVMGVTALANITNSAVNAGKKMLSALTIDPIKAGFQEYETQINSTQTILANTESKGSTIDDVNLALEELNKYADKTIYNFTEMTRNIGTFTAAGIDLETSVNAIQGIANLAAVSGSTSQQASTAMYQLSQALASGTVKLMDWNSVVNAGMGGQIFQDALKKTSEALGTGAEAAIAASGSFRESLKDGWLTSEVLTETLKTFTTSGAFEAVAEYTGLTKEAVEAAMESAEAQYGEAEAVEYAAKALAEKSGKSEEEIKSTLKFAKNAEDAATKVKTFTQLWDVMKEAAQSGWAQTWKLIVGDFEEAKALLSPLADFFTGVINGMSDARNKIVEGVMNNPFTKLIEKVNGITENLQLGMATWEEYEEIVNRVIRGDFGNQGDYGDAQYRNKKLTEAGYDYAIVQTLVNKQLGVNVELCDLDAEAQKRLAEEQANSMDELAKMSDEQLKNLGLTEDQIAAIRELSSLAKKAGMSMSEFIESMDGKDGRTMLIESLSRIGKSIADVFGAIGDAWSEVFPAEDLILKLYGLIQSFHKFSENLVLSEESADKLKRTFKGVFTIFDMVGTILGGPIKIGFKVITQLLGMFGTSLDDVLTFTAGIGDAITKFWEFADVTKYIAAAIEMLVTYIKEGFAGVPGNLFSGFINGFKDGFSSVAGPIMEFGEFILAKFREVLGIHSPSTETHEDGKNFVQGFIEGLKSTFGGLWGIVTSLGGGILSIFRKVISGVDGVLTGIDFGTVIAGGFLVGMLAIVKKLVGAIAAFSSPFDALGEFVDKAKKLIAPTKKIMKSISKTMNAFALSIQAKALVDVALAIAIIAGSVALLTLVDTKKLIVSSIALALLIGALALVIQKLGKMGDGGEVKIIKFTAMMLALSGAVLILALVIKLIGSMDPTQAGIGIAALAGIMGGLFLFVFGMSKLKDKDLDNVSKMMIKFGAAMLLIAVTMRIIGDMEDPGTALACILGLGIIIAGLIAATRLAGGNKIDEIGATLIKLSGAILILALVAKLICGMEWDEMGKAALGILFLGGVITGLIAATRLAGGNDLKKIGSTLIAISGAMLLLSIVAKILATMDWADMGKAAVGIVGLGGIIVGLIAATRLAGGNSLKGVALTLMSMAISITILTAAVVILGFMDIEHLAKGVVAIGFLAAMMALMIASTKNAQDCKSNLIVMAVAIAVMAASVVVLSFIEPDRLKGATAAMGILMGMFALIAKASSNINKAMGMLIVMTIAIGVMAAAIYILAGLPVESTIGSAIALSTMMLAFSAALTIVSLVGKNATGALKGVLVLTAMSVPLFAFIGALAVMTYVSNAMENAKALSLFMSVMTLVLGGLTIIGTFATSALIGVGALALLAVPLFIFIGAIATIACVPQAEANAKLLMGLMVTMTAVLAVLAVVGPFAYAGVGALAALTTLMVGIGALAVAIGALMTKFPQLQQFLDTGIPVLEKIAHAIGSFVGNLIGGLLSGITSSLPAVGLHLGLFMTNLAPFLVGVKMVDTQTLAAVGILAAAIIALTASTLLAGIMSFGTMGGLSMAAMGAQLSAFMIAATPFVAGLKMIKPEMIEGVKALAETILILTAADLLNGISAFFGGGASLTDFASQLPELGRSIGAFADSIGTFDETKAASVKYAADSIKTLAEAAKTMPKEGGIWQSIVGENGLSTFSSSLPTLGANLRSFIDNLGTFDDGTANTVTCAGNAIKSLAEAAKNMPAEDGLWQKIVGENGLATFSDSLGDLGTNLGLFVSNLGTFDDGASSTVTCAGNAIKALAEAAKTLPAEDGIWQKIVGENSLATFGEKLPGLATDIASFVSNLGTFGEEQIVTVRSACNAIKAIAGLGEIDIKDVAKGLKSLGGKLTGFAKDLASFVKEVTKVDADKITTAITNTKAVINLAQTAANINVDSLSTFGTSLATIATEGVAGFVKAYTSEEPKKQIADAAEELLDAFIKGAKDKTDDVIKGFKKVAEKAADKLDSFSIKTKYKDAGKNLTKGFAEGIKAETFKAEAAAAAMAKAAKKAAEDALGIESPSKELYKDGKFAVQGFVNALYDHQSDSYDAGYDMATSAKNGLERAVGHLGNILGDDLDSNPTIRPVLDLSEIRAGTKDIAHMLDLNSSVGIVPNVHAINTIMSRRNQNGANDDVVDAIGKLRKDLGNVNNTSYNINGITYNSDSDVGEAIKTLIRAIRIEERV